MIEKIIYLLLLLALCSCTREKEQGGVTEDVVVTNSTVETESVNVDIIDDSISNVTYRELVLAIRKGKYSMEYLYKELGAPTAHYITEEGKIGFVYDYLHEGIIKQAHFDIKETRIIEVCFDVKDLK